MKDVKKCRDKNKEQGKEGRRTGRKLCEKIYKEEGGGERKQEKITPKPISKSRGKGKS